MNKPDKITIEILPDGRIKTSTDQISAPNHQSAAAFLKEVGRLAGGAIEIVKKLRGKEAHEHTHTHEDATH